MKQNDLEKLFRDRLRSDRPKVDTDRLWQKLEDKLPSGNKRRPPFFGRLSGIGILIFLGVMLWWGGTFFHENKDQFSAVTGTQNMGPAPQDDLPRTQDPSLSGQQLDQNETHTPLHNPDINQLAMSSEKVRNESQLKDRFESDFTTEAELGESDRPAGGSENPVANPRKSVANIFPDSRSNNRPSSDVNELPGAKQTVAAPVNIQNSVTTPEVSHPGSPVSDRAENSGSMPVAESRWYVPASIDEELRPGSEPLRSLKTLSGGLIFPVTDRNNKVLTLAETPDIQRVSERNRSHSLSLFMGIGLTGRQLDDLTTQGIAEKAYRETTERVLENWTAALAYRYQPGKWYMEASVSGGWFNEKVHAVSVTTDSLTLDNVVIEQVMQNGQVIEERRGTVTVIETMEQRVLSYPKLFHLQAGLGLGRSWSFGKNTSLLTGAGLLYSFYHAYHRGTLALQPDLLYELDRNEGNRFSDAGMQFGGYLSVDLRRHFSAKWSGSAGLRASVWPKGIANEIAPVQQRYQSYSLTLGIGRHF